MNKYLTGLVAVTTVTTMGVTSIPASAKTLDEMKSAITNAIDGLESIGYYTSQDEIKALYSSELDSNTDTDVIINENTPNEATIKVILNQATTTPQSATLTFENIPIIQSAYDLGYIIKKDFEIKQYVDIPTVDEILSDMTADIKNNNLSIKLSKFNVTQPTTTAEGNAEIEAIITDTGNNNTETKLNFNVPISIQKTAEENEIISKIANIVSNMNKTEGFTNNAVENAINEGLSNDGVTAEDINLSQSDNACLLGDYTVGGHIINASGSIDTYFEVNGYIYQKIDNSKSQQDIEDDISKSIGYIKDSDYNIKDTQAVINRLLTGTSLKATVSDYLIIPKTATTYGEVQFVIRYTNIKDGSTDTTYFQMNTDEPRFTNENQTLDEYKTAITEALNKLAVSNGTTVLDVERAIGGKIQKWNMGECIKSYSMKPATSSSNGSIEIDVWVADFVDDMHSIDNENNNGEEIKVTLTIPKLASNGSSSSSSHNHSSNGSAGSASNTGSTSTSSNGTAAVGGTDITKVVSLANMSKEAVKAVEAKVVSNLSMIIGTGATAGQAKEIATADGSKLSVTTITKDGKSAGAVITAEAPSAKAVIPINKDQAPVAAVYKYVPLLGKYIQVQDAVVTADAVTLSVQANATYVASPVVMGATETIKQGWVQANNSWYMVNSTGDPLTGWQKDSTGWTYMSSDTGVMQTGWAQTGGNWYYLKSNGYMATGWVQNGATWYYCNSDGSMAANTTVDGYQLDANGAWIG